MRSNSGEPRTDGPQRSRRLSASGISHMLRFAITFVVGLKEADAFQRLVYMTQQTGEEYAHMPQRSRRLSASGMDALR